MARKRRPHSSHSVGPRMCTGLFVIAVSLMLVGCASPPRECGPTPGTGSGMEWLQCRAEEGSAAEQYALAVKYLQGAGVTANAEKAAHWLKLAAAPNTGKTMIYIPPTRVGGSGSVMPVGNGPATPGLADAQYVLGQLYEKGIGVEKNAKKAQRWIERAARQGHRGAIEALNK